MRDRDRVLYSSAFQRLAGITQVISPAENRICHSRLTHSLKVGQVARRIAERLIALNSDTIIQSIGGINPDVVEAASLAHDIGHPPFGHAAEVALQKCFLEKFPNSETYEGNAQSFRVVTKLAVRSRAFPGLDLTRATLNALLKYPWNWKNKQKPNKWGAYEQEEDEFEWARHPLPSADKYSRTAEAEIMDIADDISYAVHDLEDFYRAGMVPLDRLLLYDAGIPKLSEEGKDFISQVFIRNKNDLPASEAALTTIFINLLCQSPVHLQYKGGSEERAALRAFTSFLIGRYVQSIKINPGLSADKCIFMPKDYRHEVYMLQQLTWHYMILNPSLSTQQHGQIRLIKELFNYFYNAAELNEIALLPRRGKEMIQQLSSGKYKGTDAFNYARLAADLISYMTEPEVRNYAHKIMGYSQGSAFD